MTDLNTNQYLYKQPYLQNQPTYGDGKGGFPINMDDKRLDPVKDNFKTNPVGKVVNSATSSSEDKNGLMKMPILLALGAIPTLLIDKACKTLIKGASFKDSLLGKAVNKIDVFSNSVTTKVPVLKFDWAKNAFERVKNGNGILSQIINATPTKPVNGMAKGMVVPQQDLVLKELLEEAVHITSSDTTVAQNLINELKGGSKNINKKACKEALRLARKNPSKKFTKILENLKNPKVKNKTKQLIKLLEESITISKEAPQEIKLLTAALENGTKGANKEAYKTAIRWTEKRLAGKNPSEKFIALKNKAHSLSSMSKHSPLSRLLINGYNSVSKIINIGKMGPGKMGKLGFLFGLGMTAYFLGETVKKTIDAPKKEKGSTLAHGVIVDFIASWLLFEPIMKFMHKGIGALKAVEGKGLSKIISIPLNVIGKLLNTGLDKKVIPAATSNLGAIANGFKHTGQFLKGFGGGAGRFALLMFVLFPVVDKIARFVTHSIFGKPNALLAKEKAEAESGKTENTETLNNTDALKKALEQNKAGMLTVAAKNQINSTGGANPWISEHLKSRAENINQSAVTNSPVNTQLNTDPAQKINIKQQYMPSDTSKIQQENIEKKAKFDATLAKTDSIIRNAETALGS